MKRPLVVFAAGFVLGEVLALRYQRFWPVILFLLLTAGAGGFGVPVKWGRRLGLLFLASFFAFGVLGFVRGQGVKERLDREQERAAIFSEARPAAEGRIVRLDEKEDAWSFYLADVQAEAGNRREEFERIWVYMKKEEAPGAKEPGEDLAAGKWVRIRGSLEPSEGRRDPGEFSFAEYYRSKGVSVRLFGDRILECTGEAYPYDSFLAEVKRRCGAVMDAVCEPEDAMLFKAMLLGDMDSMEPEIEEMYQKNGISHLLAISGQHLTIIGGGLYLVLRRLGMGFRGSAILGGVLVASYGILTGSSGSAMRAVIMVLCLWAAAWAGRTYDSMSALGLAAIFLLWGAPYLLTQSGFQLSFGAVLAISGLSAWLGPALGLKKVWESTLLISICVQLAITPLVVWQYYTLPLYGIFLNLLVAPAAPMLMYSGLLILGLGSFSTAAGRVAAGSGHYILAYYDWLCRLIEELPGYSLVVGRPSMGQIGGYWLAAGLWVLGMVWLGGRRREKENAGGRSAVRLAGLFAGYALAFLVLLPRPEAGLSVYGLDVGQGDGFVLRTGGFTVLVDGGSSSDTGMGENVLEPFLKSQGVTSIDCAIVSHGDGDHISGLQYLLEESEEIQVRNLVLPAGCAGDSVYGELAALGEARGAAVWSMGPGERIRLGELELVCLYGGGDGGQPKGDSEDRNAHSLVICADFGGFHMLFTGDMGKKQEREMLALAAEGRSGGEGAARKEVVGEDAAGKEAVEEDTVGENTAGEDRESLAALIGKHLAHVQVLKTAHHGSDGSSDELFLAQMPLRAAVISYGRDNSYGHPSPRVVKALKDMGAHVLETGKQGAVRIWTDGERMELKGFLER